MNTLKIHVPATIANVSCGFDVLGFPLDAIGDEMLIRKVSKKGIRITKITDQQLPLETHNNVAGVAAMALLETINPDVGFEIEIYKKIKPGSGIGSSAASAAGAVWAINKLLGDPCSRLQLVSFAAEGERLASGVAHADNVAPAVFGGFTLIRSYEPLDVVKIHTPKELFATVIHPQIEVKTTDAREILKTKIPLKKAVVQWGNVGGLISGLYTEDYELISRSLHDCIVEPVRSVLIPAFDTIKEQAIKTGALGCGISGSGPSVFALSRGVECAEKVAVTMAQVYEKVGVSHDVYVSKINTEGIKILNN